MRRRRQRVMLSAVGPLRYVRRGYRCRRCGDEHAVVDRALGVIGQVTAQAAQMGLSLLVEMPSRRASRMLVELCGLRLSSATLDRLKGRVGPAARRMLEQDQQQWLAPVSPDRPAHNVNQDAPELLVRQADAVKVRYRDGWHDVKVGVSYGLGEPDRHGQRPRSIEPKYCALRGKVEALGRELQALSLSQGLRRAAASQFVSDGGTWMAGLAEGALKWSAWTVDYYHVSGQVASALNALHGEGSAAARGAHRRLRKKLLQAGGKGAVRRSLSHATRRQTLTAETRRTVTNVIDYLRRFEEQTRYDRLRQRGWPIGSGQVEGGGCKLYIQGRFKRARTLDGKRIQRPGSPPPPRLQRSMGKSPRLHLLPKLRHARDERWQDWGLTGARRWA